MADDFLPLKQAAEKTGIDRNTLARWVKAGKLKSRKGHVRHLQTTLVSVAAVKALIPPGGVKAGRPRKGCDEPPIRTGRS